MSDQAWSLVRQASELRKERVHNTMLVELLALLIFLAMAFAFVLKEEGDRANPWKEKHDRVQAELVAAQKKIAGLNRVVKALEIKVTALEQSLRRFLARSAGTLPANDQVVMSKAEIDKLVAELANAKAVIQEQSTDNANLRARMNGGVDLPPCTVTAGPLLRFDLLADGRFRAQPSWTAGADAIARTIPGVRELASGRSVDRRELLQQTRRIQSWAQKQTQKCQFRVRAHAAHNDAGLFNRQVSDLEQTFYVSRRIGGR